jgi:hypothetical protein
MSPRNSKGKRVKRTEKPKAIAKHGYYRTAERIAQGHGGPVDGLKKIK